MANTGTESVTDQNTVDESTTGTGTTTDATTGTTPAEAPALALDIPSSDLFAADTTLQVAADGGNTLTGGDEADLLIGSAGADDITGGDGDDVLVGGGGTNILEGGGGDDIFGHSAGAVDYITDFAPGQDERLGLAEGLTVTDAQQGTTNVDLGEGVTSQSAQILTISDGSTVALIGVTEAFSTDWLIT